ncbi:hypothetical protein RRF57_008065 [Xylaria bambusicola]|uniref:Uncharacterized protein n=1 Tax=Xylaria bambusicola TaxID=326684 RepID=A0AAN7UUP1_9PEZI
MDDPFDSPPRPGQGGRRMPPRGRGMDRDSPDPFGTPRRPPPRMNPFVSQAAHAGWRPSPMEGHGGNRGTIFGSGGGLFGQFGERRPAPIDDDPFGGSTVAGPREQADRQARLQRAKELFGDTSRFTVEKSNVTTSGLLLRVVEALDDQRSRRFVVKASFPEIGGAIATERDWTYVSTIQNTLQFQASYSLFSREKI